MNSRKTKEYLGLALMAMAMSQQGYSEPKIEEPRPEKKTVVPAGSNYYHFDEHGQFEIHDETPDWAVFSCIARTDKKALQKFEKHIHE